MKSCGQCLGCRLDNVAPVRERGLKSLRSVVILSTTITVAPVRERGLKYAISSTIAASLGVAPVRERGLKLKLYCIYDRKAECRSREGAWIEIMCCGITTCLDCMSLP